jgi:hypothetical protein
LEQWTEAMQLMVEGDKWEMYIPSELGYGDSGSPPKIGGGEVLIFQMELLEIQGDSVPALACLAATGEACNAQELQFLAKTAEWDTTKASAEVGRLQKMLGKPMKKELLEWIKRRIHILQQKLAKDDEL